MTTSNNFNTVESQQKVNNANIFCVARAPPSILIRLKDFVWLYVNAMLLITASSHFIKTI